MPSGLQQPEHVAGLQVGWSVQYLPLGSQYIPMAPQLVQTCPPYPHAEVSEPDTHCPWALQQPPAQFAGLQGSAGPHWCVVGLQVAWYEAQSTQA